MITEKEALSVIPKGSFVELYSLYAASETSAPLIYHVGAALALLATTCPSSYKGWYAGWINPNIYVMCVGNAGDFKTAAVKKGRRLLESVSPKLICDEAGSDAGLLSALSQEPVSLLVYEEMGTFLKNAQHGKYLSPVKEVLMALYDGYVGKRRTKKDRIVVDEPRLSVLAACAEPYLELFDDDDWRSGFARRWIFLHGASERDHPDPAPAQSNLRPECQAWLARRLNVTTAGDCLRPQGEAAEYWRAWYEDIRDRPMPGKIQGLQSSAPALARRIAMIYGWDFGKADSGEPWHLTMQELEPAIAFTELYLKSAASLVEKLVDHPDAKLRRDILDTMAVGKYTALSDVLRRSKRRPRTVREILDGLILEGTIERHYANGSEVYVRRR